jgi:hypothetical protein
MNTYIIYKNEKIIGKRRAPSAIDAFKSWQNFCPFGHINPACFERIISCDSETYGKIGASFTGEYSVEIKK